MCKNLWTVVALCLIAGCGVQTIAPAPNAGGPPDIELTIRLRGDTDGTFEVGRFNAGELEQLNAGDVFTVRVEGKADVPPLLGTYEVVGSTLEFKPRFPLQRGVRYRAVVHADKLPRHDGEKYSPAEQVFFLPRADVPPTVVQQVYPTRDVVPENLLRFYIHFSAPMSRGDVYKHVRLLGPSDQPIEMPFLELEQELWDASSQRFTLFIQPGRIKRGLQPREELGPVLEEGRSYTLEIDREWLDANGEPLKETYRKKFRAAAPDETQPDPRAWKVQPPAAGGTGALAVSFPRPLDHGMLERVLWVTDERGQRLEGTVAVTGEETRWQFTPKESWRPGAYSVVVNTALEDPTGNSIARPFEVDVFRPIEGRIETRTTAIPFMVK
jgi:hypothetical protein